MLVRYFFCSLCLSLTGCLASSPSVDKPDMVLLLEQQKQALQEQLSHQAQQLNDLRSDQAHMSSVLEDIRDDMAFLQLSRSRAARAVGKATKKVSSTTEEKKQQAIIQDEKVVLGRNEWVWIDELGQSLKARIDTGATTSSLSAADVQPFERDGDKWVRFSLARDGLESPRVFETPLLRFVKIRQASLDGLERRAVVRLKVRIGDIVEVSEFTLADRNNMNYPILLGRSFLRDIAVVDVARKFTQPKLERDIVKR